MSSSVITPVPTEDRPVVTLTTITPVPVEDRPVVTLPVTKTAWTTNENVTSMPNISTLELDTKPKPTCPTCGVRTRWSNQTFNHKICVPSIGPAKPIVYNDDLGRHMRFDTDSMSEAERIATGCNISRCQTVTTDNCALCFHPCQEQSGSMWNQFTGWKFVHMHCWQDLCLRYHEEYLEPNRLVNTLANWLKFLED